MALQLGRAGLSVVREAGPPLAQAVQRGVDAILSQPRRVDPPDRVEPPGRGDPPDRVEPPGRAEPAAADKLDGSDDDGNAAREAQRVLDALAAARTAQLDTRQKLYRRYQLLNKPFQRNKLLHGRLPANPAINMLRANEAFKRVIENDQQVIAAKEAVNTVTYELNVADLGVEQASTNVAAAQRRLEEAIAEFNAAVRVNAAEFHVGVADPRVFAARRAVRLAQNNLAAQGAVRDSAIGHANVLRNRLARAKNTLILARRVVRKMAALVSALQDYTLRAGMLKDKDFKKKLINDCNKAATGGGMPCISKKHTKDKILSGGNLQNIINATREAFVAAQGRAQDIADVLLKDYQLQHSNLPLLATLATIDSHRWEGEHVIEAEEGKKALYEFENTNQGEIDEKGIGGLRDYLNNLEYNGLLCTKELNINKRDSLNGSSGLSLEQAVEKAYAKDGPSMIQCRPPPPTLIRDPRKAVEIIRKKRREFRENFVEKVKSRYGASDEQANKLHSILTRITVENERRPGRVMIGGELSIQSQQLSKIIGMMIEIYLSDLHFTYDSFFDRTYSGDNAEPSEEQKRKDAKYTIELIKLAVKLENPAVEVETIDSDLKILTDELPFIARGGTRKRQHYKKTRKAYKKKGKRYSRRR